MDNQTSLQRLIREAPWAKGFAETLIQKLAQQCTLKNHVAGGYVCRRSDIMQHWFGVVRGVVKISSDASSGKTASLAGITAGGWFGEGTLLKREPVKYDAIVLCDSQIACMPLALFDELLNTQNSFNRYLLIQLNERLGQMIGMLESERLQSNTARVARSLAQLFNPVLYPNTLPMIEVSQAELGYLCGLSRQRINQALQILQDQGILRVGYRQILIDNLSALQQAALEEDDPHQDKR